MSQNDVHELPTLVAQSQITDAIARSIIDAVAPGWSSIQYRRSAVSAMSESRLVVVTPSGTEQPRVPRDVAKLAAQLRDVMYRPGRGTWYSFTLDIQPPGSAASRFTYDDEPAWDVPADPVAYVTDQHTHPRDAAHQPAWLRGKLVDGWAQIHRLAPDRRPAWVAKALADGTHELTTEGIVPRT
jgi:hypothetical protein